MENQYSHVFHFVMNRGMKKDLKRLEIYKITGNVSGTIVKIFSLLFPLINKEHQWGEQRISRYLPVCDDPDEIREHVYVRFPEEVYRQLKLIHQDLNVYSIAQLLRGFLNFFLSWVNEYGNNAIWELKKLFRKWEEENGKSSLSSSIQQLLLIIHHFSGKNNLITFYNKQFSPFWIFEL